MKASRVNKLSDGPNISGDADSDYRLRNVEEKSSLSSDEYETSKVSVGNRKELVTRYKKKKVGPDSDGENLHEEHSKLLELETSLQSHHIDVSDDSDAVEHDVKVCDTCGDAGREDLLATCCRCIDGAEHTYCMKIMVDQVPKGDWLCEECKSEVRKTNRQNNSTKNLAGKDEASDVEVGKVIGKRHSEDLLSSSSNKKQTLETISGSTKDVDRGEVKSIHQFSSDSHFGNESTEGSHSPATRPQMQSLRGALSKSSSFNASSKTKFVDEIVLQRQKSTKERSSHDTTASKEVSKPVSFRPRNLGSIGPSGSKVKMLSQKLSHVQDLKSPKNKKERSFEKSNSVKLSSSSAALTPTADRLLSSRGETNMSLEAPVLGQINEQLSSSPTRGGTESVNLDDGIKENTTGLNPVSSVGNNGSSVNTSKDVKNRDNKLKDAIEAALLKKPGIYRKNKVSNQPNKSSVPTMNYEAAAVDGIPNFRNAGSLTSADVSSSTDWHVNISRSSSVDHSKQSNGNSYMQSSYYDMALFSHSKNLSIPDQEYIWQGSFEINRSGKKAEFWDGLQAHLSICASSRVFEAVNEFPHKILLNGVSRASAWPAQFENNGVKEDNIAIYFFAKDVESYEKSYQVLLDEMIRGDLALIGSINGVELLIFPSNQLPEKSNRWNMFFFLWGVLRGKKKNSLHHNPNNSEKNCVPQFVSSISSDKISLAENVGSLGSVEKDKHVDSESMVNSTMQNSAHEKAIDSLSRSVDSVNVVPVSSKERILERHMQNKRIFIDLSEDDDDDNGASQKNTRHDSSGQLVQQEGNLNKKQKMDLYGARNNSGDGPNKKPEFALDLNEDISCLVGETENILTKKDFDGDDVASLSLSLPFLSLDEDDEDNRGNGKWQSGPMLLFQDLVDKQ